MIINLNASGCELCNCTSECNKQHPIKSKKPLSYQQRWIRAPSQHFAMAPTTRFDATIRTVGMLSRIHEKSTRLQTQLKHLSVLKYQRSQVDRSQKTRLSHFKVKKSYKSVIILKTTYHARLSRQIRSNCGRNSQRRIMKWYVQLFPWRPIQKLLSEFSFQGEICFRKFLYASRGSHILDAKNVPLSINQPSTAESRRCSSIRCESSREKM